jgi:hypothetical protein
MRFSIFLLVALALLLVGAEAKYSPGLEIASGEGIKFSGTAPTTTADVLYSDSGTLMFGDAPVDNTGTDTLTIYQKDTTIVAKSHDGHVVATGTVGIDDLAVLHAARDYCHTHYPEGATIALLNGRYEITTFEFLHSNLTLKLKRGVVIEGNTTLGEYPIHVYGFPTYTENYVSRSMFWAQDVQNIGIIGEGTIDGNGDHTNFNNTDMLVRPYIIRFCNVTNFNVGGTVGQLRFINPAMWSQHYLNCSNGIISKQYINTNERGSPRVYRYWNLDGIDIDCCDGVMVSEIDANCGDDAICLKASGPKNCTNITVTNCKLSSRMCALKMGTESNGGFQNILVSNINIYNSLAGIGISTVDGGQTHNIIVTNINIDHTGTPFYVWLGIRNRSYGHGSTVTKNAKMNSITLQNIVAWYPTSVKYPSFISGYGPIATGGISGISVMNYRCIHPPGGGSAAQSLVTVPEVPTSNPSPNMLGTLPAYGLYVRHVHNSNFRNIDCQLPLTNDDRPVVVFSDVGTSCLDGCQNSRGSANLARIYLNATRRFRVTGASGSSGTLFRISNSATADVLLLGNDCVESCTLYTAGAEVSGAAIKYAHNPT